MPIKRFGELPRPSVTEPPVEMQERATKLASANQDRLGVHLCGQTAEYLARAAKELRPDVRCAIVGGYARSPRSGWADHVWTRIDGQDFDMSWSLAGIDVKRVEYREFFARELGSRPSASDWVQDVINARAEIDRMPALGSR